MGVEYSITSGTVYITHYDADGIATVALLELLNRTHPLNGNGKNKANIIYSGHSDLPDHLSTLGPKISGLYITDLAVTNKKKVSEELLRIANGKKAKGYHFPKMITIITDKKIPLCIRELEAVDVYSANRKKNANRSSSQIAYSFAQKLLKGKPDNIFDPIADLGAAADGHWGVDDYSGTFETAIELDNAILENKKDTAFLDEIVRELGRHGSINDVALENKIKEYSETFADKIAEAYDTIRKNITLLNEHYLVSTTDGGILPFGKASSQIRREERKNIIMISEMGYILMRGHCENSLDDLLNKLREIGITGGGHDGDRPTRYLKFEKSDIGDITAAVEAFCSAAT